MILEIQYPSRADSVLAPLQYFDHDQKRQPVM